MTEMQRGNLPIAIARKIGAAPPLPGEVGPNPQTMLDWALHWSLHGLYVFPCDNFVGNPLVERWHKCATVNPSQIAELWSLSPDADIACVPDRSGHFVIGAVGAAGADSLQNLEESYGTLEPAISVVSRWGNQFLFFTGSALSSHEKLGPGLHVVGSGRYIFLPPSLARLPEELPDRAAGRAGHVR